MEYAIKEIARVIGAKTNQLLDDTVSLLLTDSRRLSFPEKSLFFALKTKTNDGHRYIQELYKLRVRNFVVSDMLPEFESMKDANFLIVKDTLRALQKLATHHRKQFNMAKAHFFDIRYQLVCQFCVSQETIFFFWHTHPRA